MKPRGLLLVGCSFTLLILFSSYLYEGNEYNNSKNIYPLISGKYYPCMSDWQDTGKKGRKKAKDTVRADVGASSYPGSAGTKPVDSVKKDNRDVPLTKTGARANVGDSAYPGSGTTNRENRKVLKKETKGKKNIEKNKKTFRKKKDSSGTLR